MGFKVTTPSSGPVEFGEATRYVEEAGKYLFYDDAGQEVGQIKADQVVAISKMPEGGGATSGPLNLPQRRR